MSLSRLIKMLTIIIPVLRSGVKFHHGQLWLSYFGMDKISTSEALGSM